MLKAKLTSVPLQAALFEGVVSFRQGNDWLQPLRLKAADLPLHDAGFADTAAMTSGCRLRCATTSTSITLLVVPDEGETRKFDLTSDSERLATIDLAAGAEHVVFADLPPGRKVLEVWLPTHQAVRIRALLIDNGSTLEASPDTRKRWVVYGSSITHCGGAHSPSRTWPAVAARLNDLNVTSLGYGGQCQMDTLVAMMIRDLPADVITLKLGINMVGGSVSPRTFFPLAIGMVKIIREKHPTTPIIVVSPIISPPREETPGATGMTLPMMRQDLQTAVARLRDCGDTNIHYFSGLDLFGADLVSAYLPDLLHPNGDGYEIMGRVFAAEALSRLGSAQGAT